MLSNSEVQICNKALDLLGQTASIGNILTPTTDDEKICARHYHDTLDFTLRKYVWNFATHRAMISRDARNTPEFDYTDAYKLPSEFVRLLSFGEHETLVDVDFDLSGGFLLLNNGGASALKLRYIRRITDVAKFDAGFKKLLTLYLAADLAYKFTAKQTVLERLYKLIEMEEAKVVSIDGQERPPKRVQYSRYARARRGFKARENPLGPIVFEEGV